MSRKKTYATTEQELEPKWHHIDANGKVLGRLATVIVKLLEGKHKVNYVPYLNCGDIVVVTNAEKILLTGNKEFNKIYHHHTGNPKGYSSETADKVRAKKPANMIKFAVNGMLPKNKLRKQRMANLKIVVGDVNPYAAQISK